MTTLSLDNRTVFLLITAGNLMAVVLLSAYKSPPKSRTPYKHFILSKTIQSASFSLLYFRDVIPDLFSSDIANSLIFVGYSLESAAVLEINGKMRRLRTIQAVIAGCGIALFWAYARTPNVRIVIAASVIAAILTPTGIGLLRSGPPSGLRWILATLYGLFALTQLARAGVAATMPAQFGLMSAHPVQSLSFLVLFLLMLIGCSGFPLLLKEEDDRELKRSNLDLAEREAVLKGIFDSSGVAIFVVDHHGKISHANEYMAKMFNCQIGDLVGHDYVEIVPASELDDARQRFFDMLDKTLPSVDLERRYYRHDGSEFWGHLTGKPFCDTSGRIIGLIAVITDVTENRKNAEKILSLAQCDSLTGLANRALLSDRLQQATALADRNNTKIAFLYLDLDNFKPVNDTYGHRIGDILLKEVAQRLSLCVRKSDAVARIGGDEFVVMLQPIGDEPEADRVAEKIRQAIHRPYLIEGHSLEISSSIGIAIYPDHGKDEDELYKKSDLALYRAKREGRDNVRNFVE